VERCSKDPSPLVGEGSGALARSAGLAPREGGMLGIRNLRLTPLRAPKWRVCSPTRGERGVRCDAQEIFEDPKVVTDEIQNISSQRNLTAKTQSVEPVRP